MAFDPEAYQRTLDLQRGLGLGLPPVAQQPPGMAWQTDDQGRQFIVTAGQKLYRDTYGAPPPLTPPATGPRSGFMGLWGDEVTGAEDLARLEQRRQIETAGLVSGLGQAAQIGATFIPTAQDRYNRERMGEIDARRDAIQRELKTRDFGYDAEERALVENMAMAPVLTLASESRKNEEAALASMGGTSAAAQVRAKREERSAIADQARKAALQIEGNDLTLARQQIGDLNQEDATLKNEYEEGVAYKAERAKGRIEAALQAVGAGTEIAGRTMAGKGQQTIDPRSLKSFGLTPDQISFIEDVPLSEQSKFFEIFMSQNSKTKTA